MKILIAEDNVLIAKTLELCLQKDGYEIICTYDGLEAMEKIELETPDLIIVDINLPYLTGLEILSKVKQSRSYLPVIVISSDGQENVVAEAKQLGADEFIEKPFNLNSLTFTINQLTMRAATA